METLNKILNLKTSLNLSELDREFLNTLQSKFDKVYTKLEQDLSAQLTLDSKDSLSTRFQLDSSVKASTGRKVYKLINDIPYNGKDSFEAFAVSTMYLIVHTLNSMELCKEHLVRKVLNYLEETYKLPKVGLTDFLFEYGSSKTYNDVVSNLITELGTSDFTEFALKSFKEDCKSTLTSRRYNHAVKVTSKSITLEHVQNFEVNFMGDLRMKYDKTKLTKLFKGITLFNTGVIDLCSNLKTVLDNADNPCMDTIPLGTDDKVSAIKMYKNSNVKITFKSTQDLNDFLSFYNIDKR